MNPDEKLEAQFDAMWVDQYEIDQAAAGQWQQYWDRLSGVETLDIEREED